jgi:hypothetical protein
MFKMLDVYEILKFDNPNGGAWKQGWDVQIDSSRFTEADKLKVFVIPHSHNDPGKNKKNSRENISRFHCMGFDKFDSISGVIHS